MITSRRSVDVRSSIVDGFRRDLIGPAPQDVAQGLSGGGGCGACWADQRACIAHAARPPTPTRERELRGCARRRKRGSEHAVFRTGLRITAQSLKFIRDRG
jgi:hypothetical protein